MGDPAGNGGSPKKAGVVASVNNGDSTPIPPHDVTMEVVRLTERSEVGEKVPSTPELGVRPTTGRLRIEGGPPGARIKLQRRGGEPLSYAVVLDADGRHEREHVEEGAYDLVASRAGFHQYESNVQIAAGDMNIVRLALRERDGIVSVDTDPPGAEVTVDGAPVGATPLPGLAVLPGERVISVSLMRGFLRTDIDTSLEVSRIRMARSSVEPFIARSCRSATLSRMILW